MNIVRLASTVLALALCWSAALSPVCAQENADAPPNLERKLRNYRIRLTAEGTFRGTVHLADVDSAATKALTNLTVWLVQNGETKAKAKPNDLGEFEIDEISPGIYSLIAAGQSGYVAFGLQILPAKDAEQDEEAPAEKPEREVIRRPDGEADALHFVTFQEVADSLQIESLAVPRRDFTMVSRLMQTYIPATVLSAKPGKLPEEAQPEAFEGEEEEEPEVDDTHPPSTVLKRHSVMIQPDGTVVGRTRRLHPETGRPTRLRRLNVFLIEDNTIVGQAPVSETGTFTFRSVQPGLYSFVASGLEGFAAFSVRIIASDQRTSQVARELIVPVAFDENESLEPDSTLVPPEDLVFAFERLETPVGPDLVNNSQPGVTTGGSDTSTTSSGTGAAGSGALISSNPAMSRGPSASGGGAPGGGGFGTFGDVPEVGPHSAGAALALLIGAVLLVTDLRRRAVGSEG